MRKSTLSLLIAYGIYQAAPGLYFIAIRLHYDSARWRAGFIAGPYIRAEPA
jgi:hypothetical protein